MKKRFPSQFVHHPPVQIHLGAAAWLILLLVLVTTLSACAVSPASPTFDPLTTTAQALQTEQAILQFQLADLDRLSQTLAPTATAVPTRTALPSPTQPPNLNLVLPRPVFFLRPDEAGIDQVYRLERDGQTLVQLTFEPTSVLDYDTAVDGDLAYIINPVENSTRLVLIAAGSAAPTAIVEVSGPGINLQHIRWLPDGDQFVFHRTVTAGAEETPAAAEATPTPQVEPPVSAQELVLYNQFTKTFRVLLRSGPQPLGHTVATVYTDESLEYAASKDWTPSYQLTTSTPDGRFLLIKDNGAPFWLVYDLRLDSANQLNIAASSADLSADGQTVCLASNTFQPDFQPPQALLCANPLLNSVSVHLSTPPWQPFGIDYWPEENAVVFLQKTQQSAGLNVLEIYGLNLSTAEPLLLRSEPFVFTAVDFQAQVLYAPQENQDQGLVLLVGQALVMGSPGVVLLPLDPKKQPIYLSNLGALHQPRWGSFPSP